MAFAVDRATSRRRFLQFLMGSPLAAYGGFSAFAGEGITAMEKLPDPTIWAPLSFDQMIKDPKDAINVFDFEPVARLNVPPAHFGYMASGIDDEVTLRANREDFLKLQLRPRRLNDVSKVDTSIELFGMRWDSPVAIAPTGGNRAYHADGEIAVSKAAAAGKHLQILSTSASTSIDDVIKARGAPVVWFQLYASPSWDIAQALVKRAENAGSPVVAVTIDRVGGRNQETFFRLRRTDTRTCSGCHDNSSPAASVRTKPNYEGIDIAATGVRNMQSANMTWDFVKRLRDTTKMKIVLKGILAHEDAKLAAESGIVDGIIVSNHGGRGEDSGRSTIDALPEIVQAVNGRIPVLVDSGFRRGTDVVKALAFGAQAVCVGRPYLWGLGAFGQPGVEKVLELLRTETRAAMQQCGARSVKELNPALVRRV
jgi:isopentenyl diphosphate isomerase/L-lactate dehydrogenase-like FMN-dependent dehydrogenase